MSAHYAKINLYQVFTIVLFLLCFSNSYGLSLEKAQWQNLPNWQHDNFSQTLPALYQSCNQLKKQAKWTLICKRAQLLNSNDNQAIKSFYQNNFIPYQILENQKDSGLITGYYEPLLQGSLEQTSAYSFPIYGKPSNLYRDGDNRYQLVNKQKMPYYQRAQINGNAKLRDDIIAWTDDPYLLYFLQIQGSGKLQLTDGSFRHLQYADHNGYDYTSLGKLLIRDNIMKKDDITYFSLLNWMRSNPSKAETLMNENKRFIFFALGDGNVETRGSLNVPLTPQRSIAIDPKNIPQGYPLWLDTTLPQKDLSTIPYQRLVFAQDTGAAIKGSIRADVFFGAGKLAEFYAGNMKQSGKLYLLKPK